MVMVGDFFQLEPIVSQEIESIFYSHYDSPFAFSASSWNFEVVELDEVVRQEDKHQVELLNAIRRGSEEPLQEVMKIARKWDRNDERNIHLCAYKWDVKRINDHWYDKLNSKEHTFKAKTTGKWSVSEAPTDFSLKLKEGARVLITYNHPEGEYVNGERGVVSKVDDNVWVIKDGETSPTLIEPTTWEKFKYVSSGGEIKKKADKTFTQLPLKLGWALTIHAAQGMTLDHVAITANKCFAHGQLYMALSRARNLKDVSFSKPVSNLIVREEVKAWHDKLPSA